MTNPPPAWTIHRFETLDSTSDEARRRVVAGGVALPFVVRADRQTRGRGRGTNAWWSDEGSLMFTLALDPVATRVRPGDEPRLALIAALAVIEAGEELIPGVAAEIRWPNDVEAGGKKLAGILPEHVRTAEGSRVLIGVGINVATRFDAAPPDVQRLATSLQDLATHPIDAGYDDALLARFLCRFDELQHALAEGDPALFRRWDALDALRGVAVRVRQGERVVAGIGRGISPEGALLLEIQGTTVPVYGGQVCRD